MRQLVLQNKYFNNTTNNNYWWCLPFLLFLLFTIFSNPLGAVPNNENKATLIEYLIQEKTHLTSDINNSEHYKVPKDEKQYTLKMRQILSMLTMTSAKIQSLDGFLENQSKQQISLNQRLKYLQQLPPENGEVSIQERVAKVETLLIINKKAIELINDNLSLARELEVSLNDEIKKLQLWKKNYELEQKVVQIKGTKTKLNQTLSALYQSNINPRDKKHLADNSDFQIGNEVNLLLNNQKIALIHQNIYTLNLQKMIIKANILLLKNTDTKNLQTAIDIYKECLKQYQNFDKILEQMAIKLDNESQLLVDPNTKKSIITLQKSLNSQLNETTQQKQALLHQLNEVQIQLKKMTSSRQTLAEYNMESLPVILNTLVEIPNLFYKYLKTLTLKGYDSYTWLNILSASVLWFVIALAVLVFFLLNRFLKLLSNDKERSRLTGYLYDGTLTLVQRNIPYLCLFSMLWSILYFTNISYSSYQLLFHLISVWFTFRILILIARLALLERISDSSGKDVKLYYRLKWLLLFGGWTTALMVFSHLYPLPLLIQDIFNRLFMLFILTVSLVAWKSKDVIPYLLRPFIKYKKKYFQNAISLLVILVPITLFTTAIIGLLGFINLAWVMCRYQAYFLLVLVGYILIRGLVFDALELFSEWMISSLRNGWLWIEVLLKPLDKILRIILFLLSMLVLFLLYGWHSDSMVMKSLEKLVQSPIINLPGLYVTLVSTIEFFMLLAIFIWAAKWTREFCYRWLYKNARDPGIRNSLSVFTQYAIILLGTFIALHVLGLDFSGMSMVLGGLAVGMGFGLRDFASNIVGGLMLLIERPVREGDLITIGEYEGRVAHIGIRSMRVSSWDNMEVLIPNAETFNKPFTNWTHQDGIVRTVVPIRVSRADDPVKIQQLILDVLAIIPEIVPDPPAQVFLKKIDEALIEFEVRYFINVQIYTRFEVRSKVLFAITAQFKAAGICPPVEPISIEIKEGHGDFFVKEHSPTED